MRLMLFHYHSHVKSDNRVKLAALATRPMAMVEPQIREDPVAAKQFYGVKSDN
jgi:hypothetical protein